MELYYHYVILMIYILQGKILLNKTYLKYSSRRIFLTLLYENKNKIKNGSLHVYSIHKGTIVHIKNWYLYLNEISVTYSIVIHLNIIIF